METQLDPHQQRVVAEAEELGTKLSALKAFIGSPRLQDVREPERTLLQEQAVHMEAYWDTLQKRIISWSK